mmetsp:Transcript_11903/g.33535  ORF Transcript_11903/g.33535 Transcript_11903/m.33535 type:complete len:611 (+) Transcript_11903:2099-3931(+)
MFSSRNALMALAMPGLAAYAQTADLSQSIAPAVPVVFRSDWTPTTTTSSDTPDEWTGRFDLDIIDWLCGGSSSLVKDGAAGAAGPFVNCVPRSDWIITDSFRELFEFVSNGTADFALSGISVTEEREKTFDFVKPYYGSSGVRLWVPPGDENQRSSIRGMKVCIMPDYYLIGALERDYGVEMVTTGVDGEGMYTFESVVKAVEDGLCEGYIVDSGSVGPPGMVVDEALGEIEQTPYGIMLAKGNQALYDSLSAGMVSTVWDGETSKLLQWRADDGIPPNKYANLLVDSVTGFDIPGVDFNYDTSSVLTGPLSISNVTTDVTIVLHDSQTSFSNLRGDATLLEPDSEWTGVDVEIAKAVCASEFLNCVDIKVAADLGERLSLLDTVPNSISISDISVTQERLNKYLFVQPYYLSSGAAVYVKAGSADEAPTSMPSFESFDGPVCVPNGSSWAVFLESANIPSVIVNTTEDALAGVDSGICIGVARDSGIVVDGYVQATKPAVGSEEPISMAVSSDLPAYAYTPLMAIVTELLAEREIQRFIANVPSGKMVPANPLLDLVSASIGDFVVDEKTIAAAREGGDETSGTDPAPNGASSMLWGSSMALVAALLAV